VRKSKCTLSTTLFRHLQLITWPPINPSSIFNPTITLNSATTMARIKSPPPPATAGKLNMLAIAFDEAAMAISLQRPCESSGSEHFTDVDSSADLSDLVNSFLERDFKFDREKGDDDGDGDDDDSFDAVGIYRDGESVSALAELINYDEDREMIRAEVERALAVIGIDEGFNFKRRLMSHLRGAGFDAGFCKSRWEKNGRRLGGRYEYIDVKVKGDVSRRYIVEVNLAAEFEVARPTADHAAMLRWIPEVYVGKAEELRKIVKLMCGAVRQSMKAAEMQVPPWRRSSFMEAKWFGPYRRTVNSVASKVEPHLPGKREVGFGSGIAVIGRAASIVKIRGNGGGLGSKVSRLTTMLEA
ncbi:hypothetical protein LINPERHAP2_LOCUS45257, partial [Linum perenne]